MKNKNQRLKHLWEEFGASSDGDKSFIDSNSKGQDQRVLEELGVAQFGEDHAGE